MKKYLIIIIIVVILIALGLFFFYNSNNDNNTNENTNIVSGQRISTNLDKSPEENRVSNILENKNETHNKELFTFSTTIKDKSEGRLTNINITCSTLNNTIVQAGKTFSFNETIGEPTVERGYQEASIIIDHKTEKGIGGGNCQVSSTLYNAVLGVNNLTIIERHEHGKDVSYVPEGKDAAVSFGSLDFKFRNDLNHDIRIEATTNNETITIKLVKT